MSMTSVLKVEDLSIGYNSHLAVDKISFDVKEGDLVLVGNEKNRKEWPLARVTETIKGVDGKIRTVKLKMKGKTFLRPIQRLYYLEF